MTEDTSIPTVLATDGGQVHFSRSFALAGTVALLSSFLLVLRDVMDTVGDPLLLYFVVVVVALAATLLSQVLRVTAAVTVGAVLFVVGTSWHILTLDTDLGLLVLVSNNIELLTGETVLRIQQADVWVLSVTPAPLFLTWFLSLHRRYVEAVVVSGSMLTYLVLTGDAGTTVTLIGVVGAGVTLAFGEIEGTGWSSAADQAVVVLAVMVIAPLVVTVVPGGAASPIAILDSGGAGTMEANVVGGDTSLDIVGAVEQSPEPRFTVESDQPRLWRTGSYDRYTGDGWVQTGSSRPLLERSLSAPAGNATELTQRIEAETELSLFPAAWQPTSVPESLAPQTRVGPDGGVEYDGIVPTGDVLEVTSQVPETDPQTLTETGRNYPVEIREQYTQLPDSTPDRVADRTAQITQGAETPYETAIRIEEWLETNREYSLTVNRPDGDIADAFLFEMDAGYCTYYATSMATMLRSQDIPARMVVGYTPGEPVGEDEYLVRGLNSHAWVEVYFPDVGWIPFDPTPSGPRQETEESAVGQADVGEGEDAAGLPGLEESMETPASTGGDQPNPEDQLDDRGAGPDGIPEDVEQEEFLEPDQNTDAPGTVGDTGGGLTVPMPSREQALLLLVGIVGAVAWVRQAGTVTRIQRRLAIRFQRRTDPETDIERAYKRLMLVLEERHRPRETGETTQQYLDDIYASQDAHRLVQLREQARYGESVTEADADRAVALVENIRENS
jgi:transglutaminase-like putative cysteine protease